jgi:phage terminase large subunit-like protein
MTLRLGERPQTLVTTTPRPIALLRRLKDAADLRCSRISSSPITATGFPR